MADPLDRAIACAADPGAATPRPIFNAPGQPALDLRIGRQADFLRALRDDLATDPGLAGLRVASGDDITFGLLDAWATVLDVLTFYQERIGNEGYLETATERRSLLELARTIGYELAPGVAAEAVLAFMIDRAAAQAGVPGVSERMAFDPGLAVQSVPGPGENAQSYETLDPLVADVRWNAIGASLTRLPPMGTGSTGLWVGGLQGDLKRGDLLLLVGAQRRNDKASDHWDVRELDIVAPDPVGQRTRLGWIEPLGSQWPAMDAADPNQQLELWVLQGRTSLFGAHAPDVRSLHETIRGAYKADKADEWPGFTIDMNHGGALDAKGGGTVQLENAPALVAGQWLVLQKPGYRELYDVVAAEESGVRAFTLAAKTTKAQLAGENLQLFNDALRRTTAFWATRALSVVEGPDSSPVAGDQVLLEAAIDGFVPGQIVAVSEAPPPPSVAGPPAIPPPGETCRIKTVALSQGRTLVTFEQPLARTYDRAAFRLHGNVARASHGATVEQVLGSGDASASFQSFALRRAPLTFVGAETVSGRRSTLEVRVNRVLWSEVDSFLGQPPDARVYITRRADDDSVTVMFGDGVTGARLPTGSENVTARYRVGIGLAGRVRDRQLSLLLTRPLGLSGVFNPAPATGGADPESREDARANAPATVLTLGRIVSVEDFEAFARVFAGIGKARVDRVWTGRDWRIHLTVAAATGEALPPGHDLLVKLVAAMDAVRDVTQSVFVADHSARPAALHLRLAADPDRVHDEIAAALRQRLFAAFGRKARQLGDPLTLSDLVLLAHRVPGVRAVDIDQLISGTENGLAAGGISASPARWDADQRALLPAELVWLETCEVSKWPS